MNKKKMVIGSIIFLIVGAIGFLSFKFIIYDGIINNPTKKVLFSENGWKYDSKNKVYYKLGINYVANSLSQYEYFNIYVPGDYLDCEKKDDTYKCSLNKKNEINGYTSLTAPIVMPVNTLGYLAQKVPDTYMYKTVSSFMPKGFIYVYSGYRGRSNEEEIDGGAPWGVVDLKAAIRYLKANDETVPGDSNSIFLYGHSTGGALASIVGASGDSDLYIPYLEKLGAIIQDEKGNKISDTVRGVMAWCPITNLDIANEAYEWNMGQYSLTKTRFKNTWTSALSEDLAKAFASYINNIKLKDTEGNELLLTETSDGIYNSGTYYYYIKKVIENSLLNYVKDNYKNIEDMKKYVSKYSWASFDEDNMVVTISDIGSFIREMKSPNKNVPAYDSFDVKKTENSLFGTQNIDNLHWDKILYETLKNNEEAYIIFKDYVSYISSFEKDLKEKDLLGNDSLTRQNMYNPMYYLSEYYEGFKKSTVAPNWRIRTGIKQTDTPLTTEVNLFLALQNYGKINVDFETVWNKSHVQTERNGEPIPNFIAWVDEIVKGKEEGK